MAKHDIGLIGLAAMGQSLVLNMESKGYSVAAYNRTAGRTSEFAGGRARGKNIFAAYNLEEFVASLKKPRKIMLMVKAGNPVDENIVALVPLLDKGDIIIDGGNSYFEDTIRRDRELQAKGILYNTPAGIACNGIGPGSGAAERLFWRSWIF